MWRGSEQGEGVQAWLTVVAGRGGWFNGVTAGGAAPRCTPNSHAHRTGAGTGTGAGGMAGTASAGGGERGVRGMACTCTPLVGLEAGVRDNDEDAGIERRGAGSGEEERKVCSPSYAAISPTWVWEATRSRRRAVRQERCTWRAMPLARRGGCGWEHALDD